MLSLGMDIGTSTVKLVLLKNQEIEKQWMAVHHGNPFVCLKKGLSTLELAMDTPFSLCVTGSNTEALLEQDSAIPSLGDIPAIVEGVRWIIPQVGSVIEIGSQSARFITDLQSRAPQFSVNEHCAGGTGSFFEDQMSRVGCKLEDYSSLVKQAQSVPRLSGRCAVFAKTDIIHRQQEGVSTPDILLGLCYAMIRNYKATIVRRLPVCKPVVFCGGVTCNAGVIRAIRDVFGLSEKELTVPEFARYEAALGAALKASGSFTLRQLNDSLDRTLTTHHMVGTLPKLELRPGTSLAEPNATKIIPESGCALGIDIGSTSTDLVLVGADGELVDFQYLRTAGDPEGAVRKGLASIRQRFGDIRFTAVGVTGSGRERIGKRIGADAVRDEITAQAKGAAHWVPEVDTVFEIGGQDSKYISIQNGEVVDFQMNKICAAGTGSFVEEQAARMGIPLAEFAHWPYPLSIRHPWENGARCLSKRPLRPLPLKVFHGRILPQAFVTPSYRTICIKWLVLNLWGSTSFCRAVSITTPALWRHSNPHTATAYRSARSFPSVVRMARLCWHRKLWATHPADLWDLTARHRTQRTAAVRRFRRILTSTSRQTNCFWRVTLANVTHVKRP